MGKIRLLDERVINQIAAGEVVERPASVVKELMDNAVDAGAKRVVVEIEDGGMRLIRVVDDGEGMNKEDLEMAVVRHATSKVTSMDDLMRVMTHGFRGEALASVSAVSKLRLKSKLRDGDELYGWELEVDGGRVSETKKVGMTNGTEVEVRDLFFNVPGRKKFLKTSTTEARHVLRVICEQALAHPDVEMHYSHNSREILSLYSGVNRIERVQKVLGDDLGSKLVEVYYDHPHLQVRGWVGRPETGHTRRAEQYLIVNSRPVQDRTVAAAVKEAMGRLVMPKMQVPWVLYVNMSPEMVDVNVHPRKEEVKFVNSQAVFRAVKEAVESGMSREDLRVGAGEELRNEKGERGDENFQITVSSFQSNTKQPQQGSTAPMVIGDYGDSFKQQVSSDVMPYFPTGGSRMVRDVGGSMYGSKRSSSFEKPSMLGLDDYLDNEVIQVNKLYLVSEEKGGMVVIDQHAAHERVRFEQLVKEFYEHRSKKQTQPLLVAEEVALSIEEAEVLREYGVVLERLGFEWELREQQEVSSKELVASRNTEQRKYTRRETGKQRHEGSTALPAYAEASAGQRDYGASNRPYTNNLLIGEGIATLVVKSVPLVLAKVKIGKLIREVIQQIMVDGDQMEAHEGVGDKQPVQGKTAEPALESVLDLQSERVITFMACRSAVKAGDYLTPAFRKQLIKDLRACEVPYTCPHGRPVEIKLQWEELERMFKRRV